MNSGGGLSHGSGMGLYDRDYMRDKPVRHDGAPDPAKPGSKRGWLVAGVLVLLAVLAVALIVK